MVTVDGMNYVDIQVNGYAGVTFHGAPLTRPQIRHVAERLRAGRVRAILPAITTHDPAHMALSLRTMRELIDEEADLRQLMPAFHIEGPCLSPKEGYRGAHDPQYIRPASREVLEPLLEAAGGPARVAMVTLAPEVDRGLAATRWLAELGIIVCAGHTDVPLSLLREAEHAGLRFCTHLGNGTAATMDRHDNVIQRLMSLESIKFALIPDGHHLPFFVVRNWIRWLGLERCIFTTDCTVAADAPNEFDIDPRFELDRSGDTPVIRLKGTPYLAGAALTMAQGHANAVAHIGLTQAEATALCCDQPAALIEPWLAGGNS